MYKKKENNMTDPQDIVLPGTVSSLIWHYVKDQKRYLGVFFITGLVWAIDMSFRPYLLKLIINGAAETTQNNQAFLAAIWLPSISYIILSILLNFNFRIYDYASLQLYPKLRASISRDMFAYLLHHSYAYFQSHSSGSLTKKVLDVANNIDRVLHIPNEHFIPQILALLISSLTLYTTVHPIFGWIIIVWSVVFIFLSYKASKKLEDRSWELSKTDARMGGSLTDSISNIMATKLFSNNSYELSYIDRDIQRVTKAHRALKWEALIVDLYQGLALTVFVASMLGSLIYGRLNGWVTPGDFAFVLSLTISFFWSMYSIGRRMKDFAKVVGICNQGLSIVRKSHGITDTPNAIRIVIKKGKIVYDNVSFAYEKDDPLFKNLKLVIEPGQKVGLVGHSGGGKSTFIKLILRLIEPQNGAIYIDGQDISTVTQASLRDQIATIPQEPALFHRTIMENIRFAKINATDQEVIQAAKRAHCHEFISSLSNGYQTNVGERGTKLSGGQRQRIAIARAFLDGAPILLLDEATSALDSSTEQDIQQSLHDVMANRTTLVIAHRLSTLKDMDRIIVFEAGSVVQDGPLQELLQQQQGIFYKLWSMQSHGFVFDD